MAVAVEPSARQAHALVQALGRPLVAGNRVRLVEGQAAVRQALYDGIAHARRRVDLTLAGGIDALDDGFATLLASRAREGVRIRLLHAGRLWAIGARAGPLRALRSAGVQVDRARRGLDAGAGTGALPSVLSSLLRWPLTSVSSALRSARRSVLPSLHPHRPRGAAAPDSPLDVLPARLVADGAVALGVLPLPGDSVALMRIQGPAVRDLRLSFPGAQRASPLRACAQDSPPLAAAGLERLAPATPREALSAMTVLAQSAARALQLCQIGGPLPPVLRQAAAAAAARGVAVRWSRAGGDTGAEGAVCVADHHGTVVWDATAQPLIVLGRETAMGVERLLSACESVVVQDADGVAPRSTRRNATRAPSQAL